MKAIAKLTAWMLLFLSCAWVNAQQQATVTIQGSEQIVNGTWDTGTVTLIVNGYSKAIPYGQFSSAPGIAAALGGLLSEDPNSPINAKATGSALRIQARTSKGGTLSSVQLTSSGSSFSGTVSSSAVSTATTLSVSSSNLNSGSSVTFSAQVTPNSATGAVTFYDGSQVLAQQSLASGTASFITSSLSVGQHSISASYSGDSTNAASASSSVTVTVSGTASNICMYALDPSSTLAFQIASATSVTSSCGIAVASTASNAFEMEGSETLYLQNHAQVGVVGGAQLNGQSIVDTISNTSVQPVAISIPSDPFASISIPQATTVVSSAPITFDQNNQPSNRTLQPGVYCGGLTVGNTGSNTFTFSPGIYVMAGGGLTLNSQAQVSGSGVTIYNTTSSGGSCTSSYAYTPITISGQVSASLAAPTSGPNAGILFFGDRNGCATAGSCIDQINGNSSVVLNGALYFKSDEILITSSSASGYTMLVADKIKINGTSTFGNTGNPFDGITVAVSPGTASLSAGQTQQYSAATSGTGNSAVNWSVNGGGTISTSGLYTAPSSVASQQTVTVTAQSQADTSKAGTATVTLVPVISVSVSPKSASLMASQTQQFTAVVSGSSNTAVSWSVSGGGTISSSGLYTAPATIGASGTAVVTATSQASASSSASATVALTPATCTGNGYSFRRILNIDHTKVANTDQTDFPILVAGSYGFLATVANGGFVQNANGFDIFFTSDAAGSNPLDFEIDSYSPTTGASAFWVRIPTLSHTNNTQIFMWYGNASVTSSRENKAGVWRNNFLSVYHFGNGSTVNVNDSAALGYNLAGNGAAASGTIGGGVNLSGTASYTYENPTGYPSGAPVTLEAWAKAPANSDPQAVVSYGANSSSGSRIALAYGTNGSQLDFELLGSFSEQSTDTNWHFVAGTYTGAAEADDTSTRLYLDGNSLPESVNSGTVGINLAELKIGGIPTVSFCCFFTGSVDEVRISSVVRSADWLATEFNTESSPSTFYKMSNENVSGIQPDEVTLYPSQVQQFTAVPLNSCPASVTWSISPSTSGSITSGGLYTAPAAITTQQTVTVTATNQNDSTQTTTVQAVLLPAPTQSGLVLTVAQAGPYTAGVATNFMAALHDQNGSPEAGVSIGLRVTGVDQASLSAVTDATGTATFTFASTNTGYDTISATALVIDQLVTSNSIQIFWVNPGTANGSPSISLSPSGNSASEQLESLVGAFTDSNGAVVQPLSIGALAKTFAVPQGATQIQLGVDDGAYHDNFGPGFVVNVNGTLVTVPANAMPWLWTSGGLNSNYSWGVQDGGNPVLAATHLVAGERVSVAYQSGLSSPGGNYAAVYDANGVPGTSAGPNPGAGGVAVFMTDLTLTVGAQAQFQAIILDATGNPLPNTTGSFVITGANAQTVQVTSNASGVASFSYGGANAGRDVVQVQEVPSSGNTISSNQAVVTWISTIPPAPKGTLLLTPSILQPLAAGTQQTFTVTATNPQGSPIAGLNLTLIATSSTYQYLNAATDSNGHASFAYPGTVAGSLTFRALGNLNGTILYSNIVSGSWESAQPTPTSPGDTITVAIAPPPAVDYPNAMELNATAEDSAGHSVSLTWSQVSGPGQTTFSSTTSANTAATFSVSGTYVLQLSASDGSSSASSQVQVTVLPPAGTQGWIGSPAYGASISCSAPITVTQGVTLQSGILSFFSANDPNQMQSVVLNNDAQGSGQIGTFDATQLQNGSYWIQLQATNTNGQSMYSLALISVVGNCKPGRVTASVTDLVVPTTGLSINLTRNYDSLNAGTSGDFGFGWNLGTTVDLSVDQSGNVSFTLGGQRKTFYLTPVYNFLIGGYFASFSPEPGVNGSLSDYEDGDFVSRCPFDVVTREGSQWVCAGYGPYDPPGYVYTDPSGTQYTISAAGSLQSVKDIGGNTLSITSAGITSSTGLSVPFVRDANGRITKITDPQGNNYQYGYDTYGNLSTVTYPGITQSSTYTYAGNHLYSGGTHFRGNPLPTSTYDSNNRLQSVTDSLGQKTSYAYNLATNTTTVTNPPDANGNVGTQTMVYDGNGLLLSSTDPLGHTTTNVYDANHNKISVTDPLGHTTSYTYDANGNRTSTAYPQVTAGMNTTSTTTYNQYSEPTSSTDELGNVRTYNYDGNSWPTSVTDTVNGQPAVLMSSTFNSNGTMQAGAIGVDIAAQPSAASHFTYDAYGNLASVTDALGRVTSYTYDSNSRRSTMVEPLPNGSTNTAAATTTYTYDALGNLTQTSAPLGRVTKSSYDSNSNKVSDTDARNNVTTYTYDNLNRLTKTTYPTSPATADTKTYDFLGNVIDETDQSGHVTHHVYDLAGRLTSVTRAYGTSDASTLSYAYNADGSKQSETDSLGHATTYTYDAAGRLTATSGVRGTFQYGYDAAGNQTSVTDGNGYTTQFHYDSRKRLTTTTYPDSTTVTNAYDGPGNLASVTDQASNKVQYNYDAGNQLKTVVQLNHPDQSHNTTTYGYDNLGDLSSWSDNNTHTMQDGYDLLGQKTSRKLPDGTLTETRTYDPSGNLSSVTHLNGKTTTYTYDTLNRLLSRVPDSSTGEPTVSFTYTGTGKRATMSDGSGTTTYTYDNADRLITKATPEGTLHYTYDAAGHLATLSSSNTNGVSLGYAYDSQNRLSTVVDNRLLSGQNTTSYSYDPASNLGTVTYPNGIASTFTYDKENRTTGLSNAISSYGYGLNPVGNRTSATENSGRTLSWNYDGIYRLTNETISSDPSGKNGAISYGLDPVGNRTSASSTVPSFTPQYSSYNVDDQMASESYDANGNVTATNGKAFTFDTENQLVSMNSGAVRLLYDGDGNRVAKQVSGVTTTYLVDDLNPTGYAQVVEEISSGSVQRQYSYGLQRLSQRQVINSTWTPSFYGYDGLGSIRQLTSITGAVTDTFEYDAFGNVLSAVGSTPNNYLYLAEQYNSDISLQYLRARYYNPLTGRFLSRDPFDGYVDDPQTLHKYVYSGNDPVDWSDPSGRDFIEASETDRFSEKEAGDSLPPIAERVECVLNTASDLLDLASQRDISSAVSLVADLSACKAALKKVHKEVGPQPKGQPGKFGSPQAGTPQKGYRKDPGHPNKPVGDPEAGPHFNWWDYTGGKKGRGGRKGVVPIE